MGCPPPDLFIARPQSMENVTVGTSLGDAVIGFFAMLFVLAIVSGVHAIRLRSSPDAKWTTSALIAIVAVIVIAVVFA